MTIWTFQQPLTWETMSLPWQHLRHDWHGRALAEPARIALGQDPNSLWLVASQQKPARPAPDAGPGEFREGLWHHDVAELFIRRPNDESYLEFNLSPAGAWWLAAFSAPRQRRTIDKLPTVQTHVSTTNDGGWQAGLQIPLDWLRREIDWGESSCANVTLILESPRQCFVSTCDLGDGEPDFHRPSQFTALEFLAPREVTP